LEKERHALLMGHVLDRLSGHLNREPQRSGDASASLERTVVVGALNPVVERVCVGHEALVELRLIPDTEEAVTRLARSNAEAVEAPVFDQQGRAELGRYKAGTSKPDAGVQLHVPFGRD